MPSTTRRFGLPPRLDLFRANTPIRSLSRFSQTRWPGSQRCVWIKRDDQTGCATAGNKIRKLCYLLAQAQELGADTILTCGRAQSNHCRATALAAARLGLNSELFLTKPEPTKPWRGNLFLSELAGATISFIDESDHHNAEQILERRAQILRDAGKIPYIIPMGASNARGALGYVECAYEIAQSFERVNAPWDCVVCTLGSGGTSAGLELGLRLSGLKLPLFSVNMCDSAEHFAPIIADIAQRCSKTFRLNTPIDVGEIRILDGHAGGASPSGAEKQTIAALAQIEGIVLDPTYTAKGFVGMLHELESGALAQFKNPLFIHTGGLFGLLARIEEM